MFRALYAGCVVKTCERRFRYLILTWVFVHYYGAGVLYLECIGPMNDIIICVPVHQTLSRLEKSSNSFARMYRLSVNRGSVVNSLVRHPNANFVLEQMIF